MSDTEKNQVQLAHLSLIRARAMLWLSAALLIIALVAGFFWRPAGMAFAVLTAVAYLIALGFTGITGNYLGQVGIKYPIVAIVGSAVLSALVMPPAGIVAPVAVFLWLKEQVGAAYRAQQANDNLRAEREPVPQPTGEP